MQTNHELPVLHGWRFKRRTVCGIALVSFAVGSLFTTRLAHLGQVRADSNRIFELRVYHTVPGTVPELESRFRDTTSKILAKHDLKVVGYWVPEGAPAWDNTFIFMVAHSSREEAKKNWVRSGQTQSFKRCSKPSRPTKRWKK